MQEPEAAALDAWEGLVSSGSSGEDNCGDFFGDDKPKQPKREPPKKDHSHVPPKSSSQVTRGQENLKTQSVSSSESDFDSDNEELLRQKVKTIHNKLAKKASPHPAPKATQQSVMESMDFGGADEELTQRSQQRGSSRALDHDEFLAAMAKESKGKHSKLKASEDVGTAVTQTSQKSLTKKKKKPESTTEEDFFLVRTLHSRNDDRRRAVMMVLKKTKHPESSELSNVTKMSS